MKEAIKKALENKNLTIAGFQASLYQEGLEISRQGIDNWLNGSSNISTKNIPVVCKVLEIDPNALFFINNA